MIIIPLVIFILNLFIATCGGTCKGCVELDELSFDKLVKRFPVTIVKFDIAYPYGEKHEAYSTFAADVTKNVDDLLVALVGIKDYGDKDNAELAKRFGVSETYPDIKLFTSNGSSIDYPSDAEITVDNLKQFVRDRTSIYIGLPGCIKEFDEIAIDFVKNLNGNNALKYIEQTEELIDSLSDLEDQNAAKVYLTIMKKIQEKGVNFAQAERQRVKQLLTGKVTDNKRQELNLRLNILRAFDLPQDNVKTEL